MTLRTRREGNARSPRIGDVAREAGVSTATVSRALAMPDRVRPELRARVAAAVAKLGYTPNAAARSLRARRSRMVLVLILKRWSAPFFAEVLRGLDAGFAEAGYSMILGNLDLEGPRRRHFVDMMFSGHIDGAVILSGVVAAAGGRSMFDAGLPLVSICAATEGTHQVLTDEAECIVEGVRELVALGHRDFAYLSGPPGNYNEVVRWKAISDHFAEPAQAGLRLSRIEGGDFTTEAGRVAGAAYLASPARPTAVVACADEVAIGFMKTVQAAGVRVPRDVSVLGFDGIEFTDYCEPTLSTIRQPRYDLGRLGARVLVEAVEAEVPPPLSVHRLASRLVLRDSTAAPPRASEALRLTARG